MCTAESDMRDFVVGEIVARARPNTHHLWAGALSASFDDVHFGFKPVFDGVRFGGGARFHRAVFPGGASFAGCIFSASGDDVNSWGARHASKRAAARRASVPAL